MTPSKNQQGVLDFVQHGEGNAVINAKAGSGKTTTLKMITKLFNPIMKVLVIAFNKSIVNELKTKLPDFIDIRTSHSLGMKIINSRNKVKLDNLKVRNAMDVLVQLWEWNTLEQDEFKELTTAVSKLANLCRLNMKFDLEGVKEVAQKYDVDCYGEIPERVLELIKWLDKDRSTIDFVDMIYHPCKFDDYRFPKYDFVLIDECQDLNVCQQIILKRVLKPSGRFIAVGDKRQAIYGFAGADAQSFDKLCQFPNTTMLPLNECYRCGKAIIDYVHKNTTEKEIIAYEKNQQGSVVLEATVDSIKDGDMVLCRNTLPLVKLCYKFLSEDKAAYVKGRDIGKTLVNLIRRSKKRDLLMLKKWLDIQLHRKLEKLCRQYPVLSLEEVKETSSYILNEEKHNIIKLIIDNNGDVVNVDTLCIKIEKVFKETQRGGICLSTVHKSKGLEAQNVYIIEPQLMPSKYAKQPWEKEQEENIKYVAYTRAISKLGIITDWTAFEDRECEGGINDGGASNHFDNK